MAMANDLRKTLTDPTPLYFAAGTADIAVEQVKKVPELIEQLRVEAPERFDALRRTDPRAVQDKATVRAREAQAKVTELLGGIERDPRKLGETAQGLALRGVGVALEYAVKARETYERVAERGEQSMRTWRGEAADEITDIAVAVEPETRSDPRKPASRSTTPVATDSTAEPGTESATEPVTEPESADEAGPRTARGGTPRKGTPRKAAPRKAPGRKTPPPAEDA